MGMGKGGFVRVVVLMMERRKVVKENMIKLCVQTMPMQKQNYNR